MTSPRAGMARRTLLALPALIAAPARAQSWPNRPLRIVVPFGPGGPTDVVARILANGLSPALGQPVVIENRGGAGGNIGTVMAARAAPDGYTLLVPSTGFVVNASLFRNPGYDPIRDFAPITELARLARRLSRRRGLADPQPRRLSSLAPALRRAACTSPIPARAPRRTWRASASPSCASFL
jgi:tripartite-type tricarboxylate transporter receptor subunit TctC